MTDLQIKLLTCLGLFGSPIMLLALFSRIPFSWRKMTNDQQAMLIVIADVVVVASLVAFSPWFKGLPQ